MIAGNRVGVAIEQGAREVMVENNWVGLAPRGGIGELSTSDLPDALVRPNRTRGISVIAGAAVITVRNNYVAAGQFGIVVADQSTTRVSLSRNVVAGGRGVPTEAAIDVQAGTEVTIGGDTGLGNHVCGAEYGIRLASSEEAQIRGNAVGVGAATRVTFNSADVMSWGIRLDEGAVRTKVSDNQIANAGHAAISVVGDGSQDNSLLDNRFVRNELDIDLGADGPDQNDPLDADRGPNGRLNHAVLDGHEIRRLSDRQVQSTFSGKATPGSYVAIYVSESGGERRIARTSRRADRSGNWSAKTAEIPTGHLRVLAYSSAGATSEFSPSFMPSRRVELGEGANWFAWTGPTMGVAEAMSPLLGKLETVWVWNAAEAEWRGWSPSIPFDLTGRSGRLDQLVTGDVVRVEFGRRGPREFFVPAGGALERLSLVELRQGFNSVTWSGGVLAPDALEVLVELDASAPGVIGTVSQWDGEDWELIWPRLQGAWDPGLWSYPALWVRATRDGTLSLP